jgi:autotransporter adhesin
LGYDATAAGTNTGAAVSVGMGNTAEGTGAVALGDPNVAIGTGAVAIGANNTALGAGGVAIGNISTAAGLGSVALGDSAIANNLGDVALGSGSVTALPNSVSSVTVRGVAYAVAGTNPTSVVSVGAPGAERQITNVAAGQITATSTDAVNGSELYATNQAVNAISGNVSTLGTTVTGLGSQVTSNTNAIAALNNGTAGLVQQAGGAPGAGAITVGAQTGGTSVNIAGTSGARVLGGVAAGVAATDAVDVGQLQAALAGVGGVDSVQYDNASHNSVTLGGTGATGTVALNNVAAGALSATSTAAVNGAQLYAANANITNLQNGAGGVFQVYQSGAVTAPTASALESTAGGDGAVASGGASTAIGYRASASGANSVAIGANSSDGGQANVVSFGTPGNERRLTNVAPGINGTDAVNVNQLTAVSNYAASLNNALSVKVNGELAGANALSGLPFSTIPTKGMVAAGFGFQNGEGAFAVGLSHQFDDRYNTVIRAGGSFGISNSSEGANVAIGFHF